MSAPWQDETSPSVLVSLEESPTPDEEQDALFRTPEQRESHRLLNTKLELENQQFQRDMSNREGFAEKAYQLTTAWALFIVSLTACQFVFANHFGFGLTESEFIAVTTTTTASAFGFWLLVGRYLFYRTVVQPKKRLRMGPKHSAKNIEPT